MSLDNIKYKHTNKRHNTKDAEIILPFVFGMFDIKTILDIGCGNGSWLSVAKDYGKEVYGIDGIKVESENFLINESEYQKHNLTLPLKLNRQFDLCICLEVAEHLEESASDNLLNIICDHSKIILFSAAIPGQGGQNHVNEQWPDYWQKKFNKKGYIPVDNLRSHFWNNEEILWWYRQNMLFYIHEDIVRELGITTSTNVNAYVHPHALRMRIFRPKYYSRPKLRYLLKKVIQAYINTYKK